jgi:hypothetical protein
MSYQEDDCIVPLSLARKGSSAESSGAVPDLESTKGGMKREALITSYFGSPRKKQKRYADMYSLIRSIIYLLERMHLQRSHRFRPFF